MPVKIYARVRPLLPFEIKQNQREIIHCDGADLSLIPPDSSATFKRIDFVFTGICGQTDNNEDCYIKICKPLCDRVIEGYNAVLMAYGQTGCGKTFTMLGKPDHNPPVIGMIPRGMKEFLESDKVEKLELRSVEAYSTNMKKIAIFDNLHKKNTTKPGTPLGDAEDWANKTGTTTLEMKDCTVVHVTDHIAGVKEVERAQRNSHIAPTGKNPESSRGHCMYLMTVVPCEDEDADEIPDPATFVFIDLAGSEGETALTPEFCATHAEEVVNVRRMEGGVINNGLTAIKGIFTELSKKGKLAQINKVGIRRVLLNYVDSNCHMSVMFMMSPAEFNAPATTSTLYFAKAAQLVKVKPQKAKKRVNWKKVAGLQKTEIDKLTEELMGLNEQIDKMYPDGIPEPGDEKKKAEEQKKKKKKKKKKGNVNALQKQYENLESHLNRPLAKLLDADLSRLSDEDLVTRLEATEFELEVHLDCLRNEETQRHLSVKILEANIKKLQTKAAALQEHYKKIHDTHDKLNAMHE
jgi:hypothetical protein